MRSIGVWRIILLLVGGLIFGGCSAYTVNINTKGSTAQDVVSIATTQPNQPALGATKNINQNELENQVGLTLPAGITDAQWTVERGVHTIVYVRFVAPVASVNQWINQVTWAKPLSTNTMYAYRDVNTIDWWETDTIANPTSGVIRYTHPQLGTYNAHVLLDTSDETQTIVYLVAVDE